jgi:sulfite dehydrogenase (cytochrome) subunit B
MKRSAAALVFGFCASLCAAVVQPGEDAISLRQGPGSEITATRCVMCHSLDYIPMNSDVLDRAGWDKSVRKMIDRFGAPISEEDARQIVVYLADNY